MMNQVFSMFLRTATWTEGLASPFLDVEITQTLNPVAVVPTKDLPLVSFLVQMEGNCGLYQ